MAIRHVSSGEALFKQGDMPVAAYVIQAGKIGLFNGEQKIGELGEGELVGETALFDGALPFPHTARAIVDSRVDSLTGIEIMEMLQQTPERLVPAFMSAFSRLNTPAKPAAAAASPAPAREREELPAISSADVGKVVVKADSDAVSASVPDTLELPVSHLPFRIGGYPKDQEIVASVRKGNHMNIASDGPPLFVSANHCEIIQQDGKLYVMDVGSRYGTTVNGIAIGRGRGLYKAPLQSGDNQVILGEKRNSPYRITVNCS